MLVCCFVYSYLPLGTVMHTNSEKLQALKDDLRISRAWTTIICGEIYRWNADLVHGKSLVQEDSDTHTLTAKTFDELCGQLEFVCQCECLGCQLGKLNSDDLLSLYKKAQDADPCDRKITEALVRIVNY